MKSGLFLLCLGSLAPVQLIAAALIVRHELHKQAHRPTTDWLSVCGVTLLTAAMWFIPAVMASIIFTRGK